MNNPFVLWIIGLVLILLEFYLPGAVMGIAGGCLVLASIFLFAIQSDSTLAVVGYVIAVLASVYALIRFALWKIPRQKNLYLSSDQSGYQASTFDSSAIGKQAEVLTDLKPGGYVMIDGDQHQAISDSGYIAKGSRVEVIGGDGESLIVKSIKENA